jgi:hypothetical protein
MKISPLAGKPADPSILIDVPKLVAAYYSGRPDPSVPAQRVMFGTSGQWLLAGQFVQRIAYPGDLPSDLPVSQGT